MIYENIRRFARESGKTISDVEVGAGITKQTIWRWDKHSPSIDKVKAVADYLGVTIDELVRS